MGLPSRLKSTPAGGPQLRTVTAQTVDSVVSLVWMRTGSGPDRPWAEATKTLQWVSAVSKSTTLPTAVSVPLMLVKDRLRSTVLARSMTRLAE